MAETTTTAPPDLKVAVGAGAQAGDKLRTQGLGRWLAGQSVRPIFLLVVLAALYVYVHAHTLDVIEQQLLARPTILHTVVQHVQLSVAATVLVIVLAVPLGILLTRPWAHWLTPLAIGLGNLGQSIPSIGLLVLLTLWIGIGFKVAVLALTAYSLLTVLRNTIVGLQGVDPLLKEAARGLGMSPLRVLLRVELPLAVPVILAGIRTALVLTVATATLAVFINGGGLGYGLVAGIKLNRPIATLSYGIIAAVLALFADWLGGVAENLLRPRGL